MSDETTGTDSADPRPVPYYSGDVRVEGDSLDFLMRLLDTPAPSGFEEPAARLVEEYAAPWADEVKVDPIGNVHVTVNKGASGPRVMLCGHIDEIGFIVTRIDDKGLVRFEQVGGWDLSVAAGQRVRILTRDGVLLGTIGKLAPHQIKDRAKGPTLKDLWIDVGAATGDEAKAMMRIGDPIVLDAAPHVFPNGRIMSRCVDERIGAFIALEAARRAAGSDV
ncbi:MAG: endoglucanase, partial [Thermoleophilia bacterium]|nr:endoglucanase [Thermoleophilia bacterium]